MRSTFGGHGEGEDVMHKEARSLGLSMVEFVAMMAVLMATTALSVDIMLVVLPDIAADFALEDPNLQQFMVTVYLAAFAAGHILAGPLSDRLGRRPVLLGGLLVYVAGSALAVVADSYAMLLLARAVQGFGASGPRVVAVAVIRDRFVGRSMSQVLSFVMTVFIMLPIIAPALGSAIAAVGSWPPVFGFLFLFGAGTFVWVFFRLPETNPRSGPAAVRPVPVLSAVAIIAQSRQTMGYMIALGFVFGCLLIYIATSQQLLADIYGIVDWFPLVFASVAGAMVVSTIVNARLVQRVGMRRLSHAALIALVVLTAAGAALKLVVPVFPLLLLIAFLALAFFLIGLTLPNFNSIAMEPLGHIAGTGSAFVGFAMTAMGAVLGGVVGQFYDGSIRPLVLGYLIYSVVALLVVAVTERGRLLEPSPDRAGADGRAKVST